MGRGVKPRVRRSASSGTLTRNGAMLGILGICLEAGCVRTVATRPKLADVLRLETSIRTADLQPSTLVHGRFFLRNVATTAIELCQIASGMEVAAITDRGRFPLVGHEQPPTRLPCVISCSLVKRRSSARRSRGVQPWASNSCKAPFEHRLVGVMTPCRLSPILSWPDSADEHRTESRLTRVFHHGQLWNGDRFHECWDWLAALWNRQCR
jgi:hypothetical protein